MAYRHQAVNHGVVFQKYERPHYLLKAAALILLVVIMLVGAALVASAEDAKPPAIDKSGFHLLNPVPAEHLRELSTDRPDKTESAYTVDAGHFQVEMDLVSFSHDHDRSGGGNTKVDAWAVAPINLKVGLCNRVDLQTVVETYNSIRTVDRVAGTRTRQSGFGDVTSRLKVNLWGNDGGATALALMPFVKYPTSGANIGNNSVESGLIVPLAVGLPGEFGLGLMTEVDFNKDGSGSGYHPEFINSITLSHDLVGNLGGYVEFWSNTSTEKGADWIGSVDLGLTYGLTDNIQIDAGINIGVTRSADDFNPFVGLSMRF